VNGSVWRRHEQRRETSQVADTVRSVNIQSEQLL